MRHAVCAKSRRNLRDRSTSVNRIFSGFRSTIQNEITTGMITTHATIQPDLSLNRFAIIHTPIAVAAARPPTIAERVCVSHTAQRLTPAIARPGNIHRRDEKAVPTDRNTMKMQYRAKAVDAGNRRACPALRLHDLQHTRHR